MDLDDYWSPGMHHPAYHLIKSSNLDDSKSSFVCTITSSFTGFVCIKTDFTALSKYSSKDKCLADSIGNITDTSIFSMIL